jgi:prepilin-type N-terminal cleavage/methylation domain-containing protein
MSPRLLRRGFTLLEVVIVVAILAALAALSAVTFRAMYDSTTVRAGASEVFGALVSARTRTLAAEGDDVYGVHVSSTTVTRFVGNTYNPADASNELYFFEGLVRATSTLIANGGEIVFTRLSGVPNTVGTIYVYDMSGSGTSSVVIQSTGLIEYGE